MLGAVQCGRTASRSGSSKGRAEHSAAAGGERDVGNVEVSGDSVKRIGFGQRGGWVRESLAHWAAPSCDWASSLTQLSPQRRNSGARFMLSALIYHASTCTATTRRLALCSLQLAASCLHAAVLDARCSLAQALAWLCEPFFPVGLFV